MNRKIFSGKSGDVGEYWNARIIKREREAPALGNPNGKQSAQDGCPEARGIVTGRWRQLLAAGSVSEASRAQPPRGIVQIVWYFLLSGISFEMCCNKLSVHLSQREIVVKLNRHDREIAAIGRAIQLPGSRIEPDKRNLNQGKPASSKGCGFVVSAGFGSFRIVVV
ncbi:hypothetical protein [Roseibium suaedae]|uniref:hypothetical protein n=1 Tax=Roseibium suaedae TaxID=735517 RepID=UPI001114FBCC|nr:hypothetical protein [Roseibium suaedae]